MNRNENLQRRIPHHQFPAQALISPAVSTLGQTRAPTHHSAKKGNKNSSSPQLTDRAVIGWPSPLQAANLHQVPGLAPPKIPKSPHIDPRNLGSASEALRSHPTHASTVQNSNRNEIKEHNRKYTIYENPDGRLVVRRQGHPTLFVSKAQSAVLEEIISPESRQKAEEQKPEKPEKPAIPSIQVSEDGIATEPDIEHICHYSAYKNLYNQSQQDNRGLKRQVKRLLPLAFLVSDAEGVDINDTPALIQKLEWIIEDSKMLVKVLPLASVLCENQRIDMNEEALRILPHVLRKVLIDAAETGRARHAAGHYKRKTHALQTRLRTLENELARWRFSGEEEYIYNP